MYMQTVYVYMYSIFMYIMLLCCKCIRRSCTAGATEECKHIMYTRCSTGIYCIFVRTSAAAAAAAASSIVVYTLRDVGKHL